MIDNEHIARQIKAIRKLNGLTQVQFARRLGIGKPIISAIESNRLICSDEQLRRICEEFNVNRDLFVEEVQSWIK